ncbi:twin-arginine translocation signal domain-containing protein, partial [Streptomyces carpinensis]
MALNRRKFLKKSAVTGAGVALAGAAATPAAQAAEVSAG